PPVIAAPTPEPTVAAVATSTPGPAEGCTATVSGFDATSVYRARDAAGSGTVCFPAGTYTVTGPLILNVAGQRWLAQPGARLHGRIDVYAPDTTVEGFHVGPTNYTGIQFFADRVKILRNVIEDAGYMGIFAEKSVSDALIEGNIVRRTGFSGITIHALDVGYRNQIIGNHVEGTGQIAIEIWAADSLVRGNTTIGGEMGISMGRAHGSQVIGNVVTAARTSHSYWNGIELAATRNATAEGNRIDAAGAPANSTGISVAACCGENSVNLRIHRNTISNCRVGVGLVRDDMPAPYDSFVTDNTFERCATPVFDQGLNNVTSPNRIT
ncbi:MAG: right-handed parallel beta-helix repeat-containing protein, partial [Thermoleophilaceae bacterium]